MIKFLLDFEWFQKMMLWKHILKVEELTGMPLRESPRNHRISCPIAQFAPDLDKDGKRFLASFTNRIIYGTATTLRDYPYTYSCAYSDFWILLSDKQRIELSLWLQTKINKHNRNSTPPLFAVAQA